MGQGQDTNYSYRANDLFLQSYWSQKDGAFIVPDGNPQNLVVSTTYNAAGNKTSSQLKVQGDQLNGSPNDPITLGTSIAGGVFVDLNGEPFAVDPAP